ncbi:MAG: hypothetical protein A2281_09275 [Bacteroidetes bacterium RIFOXYA12_FULL_38_20]|nr:MAG: hypothetical protein A2281_09275 [Bacteroidetes bacterium RIFOXYA12_FULL_38_20]
MLTTETRQVIKDFIKSLGKKYGNGTRFEKLWLGQSFGPSCFPISEALFYFRICKRIKPGGVPGLSKFPER